MTAVGHTSESVTSGIEPVGKTGVQYVEIVKIGARIYKHGGGMNDGKFVQHRFRIAVLSEQDIDKGSAEVSIWAAGSWKFIYRLPPRNMATAEKLRHIYDQPKDALLPESFKSDRDELVRIASETCFE